MKGLFIPEITAEMFRNGCLEGIEALMAEGEIYDIDYTGWIPVSEPPKENGDYIVSLEDCVYPWGRFFNGKWFMLSTDSIAREFGKYEVIAWQPLPAPYKESEE